MRILVVGAGAIGGYFGGRLLKAGRDVTFLVRPGRAAQLQRTGLVIHSAVGNVSIANPPTVQAEELRETFDLILLSCKAYDLDAAILSIAPAVGPRTRILPLLNGMKHLDALEARFGKEAVLGGQCFISATLDDDGAIHHLNTSHQLTFGERGGGRSPSADAIQKELAGTGFDLTLTENILVEMWEKWIFIATLAGTTCLMRASVGDVVAVDDTGIGVRMFRECAAIASANGFPLREPAVARAEATMSQKGSTLAASMLRDIERGARTEAEQIFGDLLNRRSHDAREGSLLYLAYVHVKAYETRQRVVR